MRAGILVTAVVGAAVLVGCSSGEVSTGTPTAATVSSSIAPTPTTIAPTTTQVPPVDDQQTPDPAPEEPAIAEPVVVECLYGTPGPARWSDGTTRFSQFCYDQQGGDEYLRSEREANTFECDGQICRNPFTGVTYPDPDAAPSAPVGTSSDRGYSCFDDGCYWPDGSFVPNAERCGSLCGEPKTSAEIQTEAGCEAGYIDDPVLCGGHN